MICAYVVPISGSTHMRTPAFPFLFFSLLLSTTREREGEKKTEKTPKTTRNTHYRTHRHILTDAPKMTANESTKGKNNTKKSPNHQRASMLRKQNKKMACAPFGRFVLFPPALSLHAILSLARSRGFLRWRRWSVFDGEKVNQNKTTKDHTEAEPGKTGRITTQDKNVSDEN